MSEGTNIEFGKSRFDALIEGFECQMITVKEFRAQVLGAVYADKHPIENENMLKRDYFRTFTK